MVQTLLPPQGGCFVFKVINPSGISVRRTKITCEGEDSTSVNYGLDELIEVDWMEGGNADGELRAMRLANGSGWFDAAKEGVCEAVEVEDGLWSFYSFGGKSSVFVLNQPTDRKQRRLDQLLCPLQRVFFDRKVTGPTEKTFFRIQGTHDWVVSSKGGNRFLYPEQLVSTELKVFETLEEVEVLCEPADESTNLTGRKISVGELVAVDFSIVIPNDNGTGPFLRLADNSGWLVVLRENVAVLKEITVQDGTWEFQVENDPHGVTLMSHPIDADEYFVKTEKNSNRSSGSIVIGKSVLLVVLIFIEYMARKDGSLTVDSSVAIA